MTKRLVTGVLTSVLSLAVVLGIAVDAAVIASRKNKPTPILPHMGPPQIHARAIEVPKSELTMWTVAWDNKIYTITREVVSLKFIGKELLVIRDNGVYTPRPLTNGDIGANTPGADIPAPPFYLDNSSPRLF